jgi:hypothetical protein
MNLDTQIYQLARKNGFLDSAAKLIVAQARLESADYTSNVFRKNNNMFGMKYLGSRQPLAVKGTLAPINERSALCIADKSKCKNNDFYAAYTSPINSAKDLIERLFKINIGGVSPDELKKSDTPEIYAKLLKLRKYYGSSENNYAKGLKAKLQKLDISASGNINTFSLLLPILFFFNIQV